MKITEQLTADELFLIEMALDQTLYSLPDTKSPMYKKFEALDQKIHAANMNIQDLQDEHEYLGDVGVAETSKKESDRLQGELIFNSESTKDDMLAPYFCSVCGTGAYGNDNFCHKCGVAFRGSNHGNKV